LPHTVEVAGSSPVPPTHHKSRRILDLGYLPAFGSAARSFPTSRYTTGFRKMEVAMPRTLRISTYRCHKPTGQAVVTLNGKDHYLGKWNTKTSKAEYNLLIGEWLAADTYLAGAT
jgi:hypothetical protein